MNIGIDVRPLQKETQFRGIGVYLEHLLTSLAELKSSHHYVFFLEAGLAEPLVIERFKDNEIIRLKPNRLARIRFIRAFVPKNRVIKASRGLVDVILEADGELGAPLHIPSVLVFHDIIPLLFKDDVVINQTSGFRKLKRQLASMLYSRKYKWFLRQYARATHILAISKNSLNDLRKYLPATKDVPATVIYHGGLRALTTTKQPEIIDPRLPFLLYVGGIDIRKNVVGLLADFLEARQKFPQLKLVLVGKEFELKSQLADLGWYKALGENEDSIVITGFLEYQELAWLYKHAQAFVFPSRYEGFGIPILEAMDVGCPVIAYNNSSIPEVAGDAAMLVPDGASLTPAITEIMTSKTLRNRLQSAGLKQAKKFQWRTTAIQTLALLERVAGTL